MLKRLWPSSLTGQVLLAIALALLLAQSVSAVLLYRAQHERRESALVHTAAMRLIAASRADQAQSRVETDGVGPGGEMRGFRLEKSAASPLRPTELRQAGEEHELGEILAGQDVAIDELIVFRRPVRVDARAAQRMAKMQMMHRPGPPPEELLVAAIRLHGSAEWLIARVFVPQDEKVVIHTLIAQTLLIYSVILGAMALILRRITRPLAALTRRLRRFAEIRDTDGQIAPQGPADVRDLITASNAMEGRIAALLDEKDVMLGAIGHDLKTPLAALRVRIECVDDDAERARMAGTIEDITRSLDDILSLARVGRPTDPCEPTELSALIGAVAEEYEDMGEPVELGDTQRLVMQIRPTWLRRALRNLIGNALRYGQRARVSLARDGHNAVIRISDDGAGIAENQIARMLEPFTRGEPSRNSETGGAGLGLTLARAVADQHGGTLSLVNRRSADGTVSGLDAVLVLPLG